LLSDYLLIWTNFCSVLSADHVKEVVPKPGDTFLGFVTSVSYIILCCQLIFVYQHFVHFILITALVVLVFDVIL